MRQELSKLEKDLLRLRSLVGAKIRLASCELLYRSSADDKFLRWEHTKRYTWLDRWARVLCGQIDWLSDPLRRVHDSCSETGSTNEFENANSRKARKKFPPPKTHHEIHSRPATATNWRRRAEKHVPRVSPHSPASIDPRFLQIGLVQLSQSIKTASSTSHTRTHTCRQIN